MQKTAIDKARGYWPLFILGAVLFLAYFFRFREFGYYEDDFGHLAYEMQRPLNRILPTFWMDFQIWFTGRPLGVVAHRFFALLGYQFGGAEALYTIAFGIGFVTLTLMYTLWRKHFGETVAFLATLIFVLYPADTTKSLLCNVFQIHPSICFLLIGFHLFPRHRLGAYLAIAASLITYETVVPLFVFAPLLLEKEKALRIRDWILHLGVLLGLFLTVIAIRKYVGEFRVATLGAEPGEFSSIARRIAEALLAGPWRSLQAFGFAPEFVRAHLREISWPVTLGVVALTAWGARPWISGASRFRFPMRAWFFIGGLISVGYLLSFTHSVQQIQGRGTSVHIAGSVGISLALAAILTSIGSLGAGFRYALGGGVVVMGGFLAAYGSLIQADFVRAKKEQLVVAEATMRLVPDMDSGTMIILQREFPERRRFVTAEWGPRIFKQLFRFPSEWKYEPLAHWVSPYWQAGERSELEALRGFFFPADRESRDPIGALRGRELVLLVEANGKWSRRFGSLRVANQVFPLKPLGPDILSGLKQLPLYAYFRTVPPMLEYRDDRMDNL